MEQQVTLSKKEFEGLQKSFEKAVERVLILERQVEALSKRLYGRSSERRPALIDANQMALFEVAEKQPEHQKQTITYTREKPQKKKPVRKQLPAHLERVTIVLEPKDLPADAIKIGEEVTEVLEIEQPKIWVNRFVRPKYASKTNAEKEGVSGVVIADLPSLPLPRGIYGASILAFILIGKFVDHLPFYRQRQMFVRFGYIIAESTMGEALKKTCHLLYPLFEVLRLKILQQQYLQADESTIKVQDGHKKGATHLGYYWVYHAPLIKGVVFDYLPSREQKGPFTFLQNFSGNLQTDGYAGYNAIAKREDITMFACMAHVRRKFVEAEKSDKQRAKQAIDLIRQLYDIESYCRENQLTHSERLKIRQEQAQPIMNTFKNWLDDNAIASFPQSPIRLAISYALNLWPRLIRYLESGEVEIDNNLIENTIRPIALGRKNYLFAGSHDAAQNAAMIYSFMATCKLNNIDPTKWLINVLNVINDTKVSELESLLPLAKN